MPKHRLACFIISVILPMLLGAATRGQQPTLAKSAETAQSDDFSLKPPADISRLSRRRVWFTAYIDYLVDQDPTAEAVPIMNDKEQSFGIGLSHLDWCKAANEGTITVLLKSRQTRSFNFAGVGSHQITDCSDVLRGFKPSAVVPINKSLFSELPSEAPFGFGVAQPHSRDSYRLIPGRSIAIDLSDDGLIKVGEVLYIPRLKGVPVMLPDGRIVHHDGYVMAVDKVSACSGGKNMPKDCNINHLDYFKGRSRSDKLPAQLTSDPANPIDAFTVSDPLIVAKLLAEHSKE